MKTGDNSFGTDSAALVQMACIRLHLCTLAYGYTEDTRLLFQFPSHSPPNVGIPPNRYDSLKKGENAGERSPPPRSYDQHASLLD